MTRKDYIVLANGIKEIFNVIVLDDLQKSMIVKIMGCKLNGENKNFRLDKFIDYIYK